MIVGISAVVAVIALAVVQTSAHSSVKRISIHSICRYEENYYSWGRGNPWRVWGTAKPRIAESVWCCRGRGGVGIGRIGGRREHESTDATSSTEPHREGTGTRTCELFSMQDIGESEAIRSMSIRIR
jgi:hypothetical protein